MLITRLAALIFVSFVGNAVCSEVVPAECSYANQQVTTVLAAIHKRHETVLGLPEECQRKEVHTLCDQLRKDDESGVRATIGRFKGKRLKLDTTVLNSELFKWALLGKAHIISMLIVLGAEKDIQDDAGATPTMYACEYGNWEGVSALVDAGVNLALVDRRGRSALCYTTLNDLSPGEWHLLSFHETEQVTDPRAKCREIIQAKLQRDKEHLDERAKQLAQQRKRLDSATSFGQSEVLTYDESNGTKKKQCLIL